MGLEITFDKTADVIKAIHAGTIVGMRRATKQVLDGYAGYVAIRTGFTKEAAYSVTSDASTYSQAVGRAQDIDPFRKVLPEVDHPTNDTEGIVADAAASAYFLEHGTSRMAAQPAMSPAAEAVRANLKDIMAEAVNTAIRKVTG